ncbi:hypothetical protein GF386_06115 [Candidatus Pacearchaeota archaeon]|nr:hypothetical protein [Candidatus Pacearchaeota archaeon]MBD3283664.1 hypothetical protein [Candidatus Pacearchaeota archaeon]
MKEQNSLNLTPFVLIILGVLVFSVIIFTISEKSIIEESININNILKISDFAAAIWGLILLFTGIYIELLK